MRGFFVITCCNVFNVWPKIPLLPVWPEIPKGWTTPAGGSNFVDET